MNFLMQQVVANGGSLPPGPHYEHCYIYEGEHCSCGGNYQGPRPGLEVSPAFVVDAAERQSELQ